MHATAGQALRLVVPGVLFLSQLLQLLPGT